jgi:hypothetical protein
MANRGASRGTRQRVPLPGGGVYTIPEVLVWIGQRGRLTASTALTVRVNASCHEMSIVVICGKRMLSSRICGCGNSTGTGLSFGLFSRSFWRGSRLPIEEAHRRSRPATTGESRLRRTTAIKVEQKHANKVLGHETVGIEVGIREGPGRQRIEQFVSPSINRGHSDGGRKSKSAGRHWRAMEEFTNDTRDGQWALELRKEQVGLFDAYFTLGSCIEWSVELGRSWCFLV